jgi:hypothetical protein
MTHDDLAWQLRDLAHELDSSSARPVLSIDSHDTPWSYPGRTSYRGRRRRDAHHHRHRLQDIRMTQSVAPARASRISAIWRVTSKDGVRTVERLFTTSS